MPHLKSITARQARDKRYKMRVTGSVKGKTAEGEDEQPRKAHALATDVFTPCWQCGQAVQSGSVPVSRRTYTPWRGRVGSHSSKPRTAHDFDARSALIGIDLSQFESIHNISNFTRLPEHLKTCDPAPLWLQEVITNSHVDLLLADC